MMSGSQEKHNAMQLALKSKESDKPTEDDAEAQ